MKEDQLKDWEKVESERGPDLPLFEAEFRHMRNPRNGKVLKAIVLKVPDTINIIAVTPNQELILVEQFRFGVNRSIVELPAGLIDEGETPLQAAERELMEETGYSSQDWHLLGKSYVNPAYVNNACYHYLALDAKYEGKTNPDEYEDLRVHLSRISGLDKLNEANLLVDAIGHAAISALGRFLGISNRD
ncbi:MAG: NUDIX hydrolase [Saprospiraceae bacterium]|nr:NUDIX hydrolase [Saprospiraceae bacterium]